MRAILAAIPYPPRRLLQAVCLDLLQRYGNDIIILALVSRLMNGRSRRPARTIGLFSIN